MLFNPDAYVVMNSFAVHLSGDAVSFKYSDDLSKLSDKSDLELTEQYFCSTLSGLSRVRLNNRCAEWPPRPTYSGFHLTNRHAIFGDMLGLRSGFRTIRR
jgi:hypothetical protein